MAIWSIATVSLGLRLYFVLSHNGMWGVDGGAYLLSAYSVLGDEPTGTDFPRPPLAPGWLLVPFIRLFGDDVGLKIFSVAATIPMIPAYALLASRFLKGWHLVLAVSYMLLDWMLAEMWIAGVLPMIGFTFLFLILWALMAERIERPQKVIFLAAPLLIALVNQTNTGISAIIVSFTMGLIFLNDRQKFSHVLPWLIAGALLALLAFPWYTSVAPGADYTRYPGSLVTFYLWISPAWQQTIIGIALVVGLLLSKRNKQVTLLAGALFCVSTLGLLYSFDEALMNIFYRSRYLIGPFGYIALLLLVNRYSSHVFQSTKLFKVIVAVSLVIGFAGWFHQTQAERILARMISSDSQQGIEWINKQPEKGTIVTNSYSMSLYVAAMTKQPTAWSQVYDPPKRYQRQHTDVVCIFNWTTCDPIAAASRLNARYVMIERIWPARSVDDIMEIPDVSLWYRMIKRYVPTFNIVSLGNIWQAPKDKPWEYQATASWLTPVWESGSTIIYEVKQQE